MLERLYKEKDASAETTADRRYTQWLNGTISGKKKGAKQYKAEGVWVKSKVNQRRGLVVDCLDNSHGHHANR